MATNIHLLCDPGEAYIFKERSGLAAKRGIEIHAGVIDPAYVKPVFILVKNAGDSPFVINIADRIAQFLMINVSHNIKEVTSVTDNDRAGFGSSGVQ